VLDEPLRADRERANVANADHQPPVCPRILEFHGIEPHRALCSLYGCLRHNGDPDTRLDHAANGVEVMHVPAHLHDDSEPSRMAGQVLLKRTVSGHCNELSLDDIDQAHLPGTAQDVSSRRDHHELIVPERECLDGIRERGCRRNPHIGHS
jgi:hypothetical protein